MKKLLFLLPVLMLLLTSAIPPSTTPNAPTSLSADYKEAKAQLEQYKGSKLSLKEKIGLKIATKQMQKSANAEGAGKSQLVALLLAFFVERGVHVTSRCLAVTQVQQTLQRETYLRGRPCAKSRLALWATETENPAP